MPKLTDQFREGVTRGALEQVKFALEKGCSVEEDLTGGLLDTSSQQYRALHWAARYGQVEIIKYLLQAGADIHSSNIICNTPLHVAVYYNQFHAAEVLLEHQADPNRKNRQGITRWYSGGNTSLHYAAYYSTTRMVQLLLKHGADPSIVNDTKHTAAQEAEASLFSHPNRQIEVEAIIRELSNLMCNSSLPTAGSESLNSPLDSESRVEDKPEELSDLRVVATTSTNDSTKQMLYQLSGQETVAPSIINLFSNETSSVVQNSYPTLLPDTIRAIEDAIILKQVPARLSKDAYKTACQEICDGVKQELAVLIERPVLSDTDIQGAIMNLLKQMSQEDANDLQSTFNINIIKKIRAQVNYSTSEGDLPPDISSSRGEVELIGRIKNSR